MRYLFLFLFTLVSCAHHQKPSPEADLVSIDAALDHVQSSYLKGCVDAYHEMKHKKVFEHCSLKAKSHRTEVENLVKSP